MMTISIGADDAALGLKDALAQHSCENGPEVDDYGPPSKEEAERLGTDYPDVAVAVAETVVSGEHKRAASCCGTGLDAWMKSEFGGGGYTKKVGKMEEIDHRCHQAEIA